MEAMYGYKKCEIIWNFPKVTKAVIVSGVGERNVQEFVVTTTLAHIGSTMVHSAMRQ